MSEVKRWDCGCYKMEESEQGYFVFYSDYDQLKAECGRLRNSLSEAAARLAHEQRTRKATDNTLDGYLAAGIAVDNAERDTLRKQLDEARRLLEMSCYEFGPFPAINAWMEANK